MAVNVLILIFDPYVLTGINVKVLLTVFVWILYSGNSREPEIDVLQETGNISMALFLNTFCDRYCNNHYISAVNEDICLSSKLEGLELNLYS